MKRTAGIIYIITLIALMLPALNGFTGYIKTKELKGYFQKFSTPEFNWFNWIHEIFQHKAEKYYTQNFGFQPDLVRLNNQINFWLWKKTKAEGVVLGKGNYLYEQPYIDAVMGKDFVGDSAISIKTWQLKRVTEELKKKNIDLIIVFAPGKGSFYKEFIPDNFKKVNDTTNLVRFQFYAAERNLQYIDFNKWFTENKTTSPFPLYPQYGVHWSAYGASLVADSIYKYIEYVHNTDYRDYYLKKIETSFNCRNDDYDAGNSLNMIFQLPTYKMAYPQYKNSDPENKPLLKMLTVADSYFWQIWSSGIFNNDIAETEYWYYNQEIFPKKEGVSDRVDDKNFSETIEKQDVILILSNDANLKGIGWGFIEKLYSTYCK